MKKRFYKSIIFGLNQLGKKKEKTSWFNKLTRD